MKQLTRVPQELFALRAAELVRRDGTDEAMASRTWMVLQNQFSPGGECGQLAPHPSQHPPDGAVVECPLVNASRSGRSHIANDSVARTDGFAIRLPNVFNVSGGQMEERWPGIAFIREYENRDNR